MPTESLKTVSNGFARFLGLTVKRLENEIRSYLPLKKWFYDTPSTRQAAPPVIASQNISQAPTFKEKLFESVKDIFSKEKPVERVKDIPADSVKDIPYDNKTEEIKSEFIFNDLRSPDKAIRKQAQGELKNIPPALALKLLERTLAAEAIPLRVIENLNVLETFRNESPVTRQVFNKFSGHVDSAVRLAALRSLAKYRDDESFNLVASHIKNKDPEVRHRILNYLCWNFEERCLSFALAAFHDGDHRVRRTAALIMGSLKAEEAMTGLITLLNDPDKDVQESANSSLKKITAKDFGFNPSASQARKDEAVDGWKKWWRENQAKFGRPKHHAGA
jgi:hypothetical protein